MDWKTATNDEVIAAWDKGEPVWTCEMGGMGPGYEQAIQLMAFEMFRAMMATPPKDWSELEGEEGRDKWWAYKDQIDADPRVKRVVSSVGCSGAQHGAAMSMASRFAQQGYAKAMESVPEGRRILASKNFPRVEENAA